MESEFDSLNESKDEMFKRVSSLIEEIDTKFLPKTGDSDSILSKKTVNILKRLDEYVRKRPTKFKLPLINDNNKETRPEKIKMKALENRTLNNSYSQRTKYLTPTLNDSSQEGNKQLNRTGNSNKEISAVKSTKFLISPTLKKVNEKQKMQRARIQKLNESPTKGKSKVAPTETKHKPKTAAASTDRKNVCLVRFNTWKLAHINEIEEELKKHPLALYPHLEEHIPHNVFEEVVELLDPEMKKSIDVDSYVDPNRLDDFSEKFKFDPRDYGLEEEEEVEGKPEKNFERPAAVPKSTKGSGDKKCPYRAIFKYDEKTNKLSRYSGTKYTALEVADDEKKVTKEFCEYLETLAIDENDLVSESMVAGFFNNGFDTKPPLSVPIEFIDMEGVPLELRQVSGGPDAFESKLREKVSCQKYIDKVEKKSGKKKTRYRFGAWYIEPKSWVKIPKEQELKDPRENKSEEKHVEGCEELNNELAAMRGTKLFIDFAVASHKRKPQFLEDVVKLMGYEA